MTEIRRRPYMTDPGESLFLAQSPILTALRFGSFVRDTGIPGNDVLTSALCAVPLPNYRDFGTLRRWEGTRVEMMWHPLMWLPPSLARPQVKRDGDNEYHEPFDLWVVRLCIEMETAGLYEPETGTWVDVLSLAGLDIEEEMTQARLRRWLGGSRDDRLDALTLEPHLANPNDPDWAIAEAADATEDLVIASYAVSSQALAEALADLNTGELSDVPVDNSEVTDDEYVWSPGERRAVASQIVALASTCLDGASDFNWNDASQDILSFTGTDTELLDGPVAGVRQYLEMLHEQFAPTEDDIAAAEAMAAEWRGDDDEDLLPWQRAAKEGPVVEVAGDMFTSDGRRGGMSFG